MKNVGSDLYDFYDFQRKGSRMTTKLFSLILVLVFLFACKSKDLESSKSIKQQNEIIGRNENDLFQLLRIARELRIDNQEEIEAFEAIEERKATPLVDNALRNEEYIKKLALSIEALHKRIEFLKMQKQKLRKEIGLKQDLR